MQSTLTQVPRWWLPYHHPWLYCHLSCPLPLPLLCSGLCMSHCARQGSVCLSVCGLGPGPALQQIPFHGTFRVCLPLALPLPSLCPHPAPLLAPQHKGKVNHDAGLDWGIPERCDWRSQEMVTH